MINLEEKVERAHETYLGARQQLEDLRDRYQRGSGKVYAEFVRRQESLLTKIDQTRSEISGLEAAFKTLFAKNGYERTKEVRSVLHEKSEASDVLAELEAAHAACEHEMLEPITQASHDAKAFKAAYQLAYTAWARWQAYQALKECHEPMAHALALLKHAAAESGTEDRSFDVVGMRQKFVFDTLKELSDAHTDAQTRPLVPELGDCDLGPFNTRPFLSPAQVSAKRKGFGEPLPELERALQPS